MSWYQKKRTTGMWNTSAPLSYLTWKQTIIKNVLEEKQCNNPYRKRKIDPEQYNIPQCSAVAQIINRRMVFDYQKYLQQPFSIACSDLKICYDRIFHSAASLALQCLGIVLFLVPWHRYMSWYQKKGLLVCEIPPHHCPTWLGSKP